MGNRASATHNTASSLEPCCSSLPLRWLLSHIVELQLHFDHRAYCLHTPVHLAAFPHPTALNVRAHLVRERFSTEPSVQGWDGVVGDRLGRHDERVVQELASVVDERDVAHQCVDVALDLRW